MSIFTYKKLCLFSPKPPALSSRNAQYFTQGTRLSRIPQVKSHPPLFYGLCPAFCLMEIHPHPLHPRSGHANCQGHGTWWISVLLLSVKTLMCSPSQSFPSLQYLMAETLLLLHDLMLTATEFPPFLLLFPSVPYWDTPSPLYWQ